MIFEVYSNSDEYFRPIFDAFDNNNYHVVNQELAETNDLIDGIIVSIANSVSVIENNHLFSVEGTKTNITENIRLKEELEKSLLAKDQLISILSHDLRSPFSGLIGFSESLVEYVEKKEFDKLTGIAKIIRKTCHNTFNLLENLLIWVGSQNEMLQYSRESILLKDLVKDTFTLMKDLASQKGISMNCSIDQDVYIYADHHMMETVIRNLVSNAIKYTSKGGEISIISELKPGSVHISVIDSGIGMTDSQQSILFNQDLIESTRGKKKKKGTGLGLLICKELIEKNEGNLIVESELGKGSKFTVVLPLAKPI
ncbi:MAG: HAMP domain-containing histidine kinase [Bacteroidales bacterium]|nr:HAMP domain-containing histidine kinase [Bacteroidales bacterium]